MKQTRRPKEQALSRYVKFIEAANGNIIHFKQSCDKYGITHHVQPWINHGVAKRRKDRGYYSIHSSNPREDAIKILRYYADYQKKFETNQPKKNNIQQQPDLFMNHETKQKPEQRTKRISILWGLVTIEQ